MAGPSRGCPAVEDDRLPPQRPDELTAHARALYDTLTGGPRSAGPRLFELTDAEGQLLGPFGPMLVNPGVGTAVQQVGVALRFGGELAPRVREVVILAVAAQRRSAYEWYAHSAIATSLGLTNTEVEALRTGAVPTSLAEAEQLAAAAASELVTRRSLEDTAFDAAREQLGLVGFGELVALVAYYDGLALSMAAWRVGLPAGVADPFGPGAAG